MDVFMYMHLHFHALAYILTSIVPQAFPCEIKAYTILQYPNTPKTLNR